MRVTILLVVAALVSQAAAEPSPPAPCGTLDLTSHLTQHCFPEDGEDGSKIYFCLITHNRRHLVAAPPNRGAPPKSHHAMLPCTTQCCPFCRLPPLCVLLAHHSPRQPRLASRQPQPAGPCDPGGLAPLQLLLVHLQRRNLHPAAWGPGGLESARRRLERAPAQPGGGGVQRAHGAQGARPGGDGGGRGGAEKRRVSVAAV